MRTQPLRWHIWDLFIVNKKGTRVTSLTFICFLWYDRWASWCISNECLLFLMFLLVAWHTRHFYFPTESYRKYYLVCCFNILDCVECLVKFWLNTPIWNYRKWLLKTLKKKLIKRDRQTGTVSQSSQKDQYAS